MRVGTHLKSQSLLTGLPARRGTLSRRLKTFFGTFLRPRTPSAHSLDTLRCFLRDRTCRRSIHEFPYLATSFPNIPQFPPSANLPRESTAHDPVLNRKRDPLRRVRNREEDRFVQRSDRISNVSHQVPRVSSFRKSYRFDRPNSSARRGTLHAFTRSPKISILAFRCSCPDDDVSSSLRT